MSESTEQIKSDSDVKLANSEDVEDYEHDLYKQET